MDDLAVLLTNDDGVDSPGLHALYEELSNIASVTVVAPAEDQSAVGRTISRSVSVTEHELGYVLTGTPSDCVVAGLSSLCPDVDLVVAGCNQGANLGMAVLGRSGTVSAAIESAFFQVPAIAVSMYIPIDEFDQRHQLDQDTYADAVEATRYLAEHAFDAGVFDHAGFLNVNAPTAETGSGEMVVTHPSPVYQMDSVVEGDTITLENHIWDLMADRRCPDPDGSDRRAVMDGKISVSPLTGPHLTEHHEALDRLVERFRSPDRSFS